MKIKPGDFIELDYVAKIKDTGVVFDLTNESNAKELNLHNKNIKYNPIIICVGKGDVISGLDEFLVGKEPGSFKLELQPEKAFGKKRTDLIKLINTNILRQQKIEPMPGLKINIDGLFGNIVSVSGGRTLIDFNHPLAGKAVVYEITINKIVTDLNEKVSGILKLYLTKNPEFELKDDELTIKIKKLHDNFKKALEEMVKQRLPEIKRITFQETTTGE